MMAELRKFNHNAFRWLLDNIQDNREHYMDPNADFGRILNDSIGEYSEPTGITINDDIRLKPPEADSTSKRHLADYQALDFYNSLEGMTPRLATEPKILAYINHMYLHGYGMRRWPHREGNTFIANVQQHWLTTSNQKSSICKASISGRTWWMAHMATKAADASNGAFDTKRALGAFVKNPEYYHRTMEYRILRNPDDNVGMRQVATQRGRGHQQWRLQEHATGDKPRGRSQDSRYAQASRLARVRRARRRQADVQAGIRLAPQVSQGSEARSGY